MSKLSSSTPGRLRRFAAVSRLLATQALLQVVGLLAIFYHGAYPRVSLWVLVLVLFGDLWLLAAASLKLGERERAEVRAYIAGLQASSRDAEHQNDTHMGRLDRAVHAVRYVHELAPHERSRNRAHAALSVLEREFEDELWLQ